MEGTLAMLIPILVPIATFLMVLGIVYMNNQTKRAMIEKGINPYELEKPSDRPGKRLRDALFFLGAGLGLFIAYMIDVFLIEGGNTTALYIALVALFAGAGLLVSYLIDQKNRSQNNTI